jgi:hypothetical protein
VNDFNSLANYPMLAQNTAHDIYVRGSAGATGSDPQTAFAHAHNAHIPNPCDRKVTRQHEPHPCWTIGTVSLPRAPPLLNDWNGALRAAAVSKAG